MKHFFIVKRNKSTLEIMCLKINKCTKESMTARELILPILPNKRVLYMNHEDLGPIHSFFWLDTEGHGVQGCTGQAPVKSSSF